MFRGYINEIKKENNEGTKFNRGQKYSILTLNSSR